MHRFRNFAFGLDGNVPMPAAAGHRDVLWFVLDVLALEESYPANLGEIHPVALDLEALGIAEAVMLSLFPEPGHPLDSLKTIPQSPVQVLKHLLFSLGMHFLQKAVFLASLPEFQEAGQVLIAQERGLSFQPAHLERQGLVP